jgi:hypothetical protein
MNDNFTFITQSTGQIDQVLLHSSAPTTINNSVQLPKLPSIITTN